MDIRQATSEDVDAIRTIARDSLAASYASFLDEEAIGAAVEKWYDEETLRADLEGEPDAVLVLVADTEEGVVAFSQSELVGESHDVGRLLWIHVDPDHRERGRGVRLLARTREELLDLGADEVRGVVLEDNEVGNEFYAAHGFERAGTREVDVGDERFTEHVYVEVDVEAGAEGPDDLQWRAMEPYELEDGETVYVSYGEAARGAEAPFYSAYRTEAGSERYGWFCGNCDTLDNAMDAMGRIECNVCGNRRKATRWDASYL